MKKISTLLLCGMLTLAVSAFAKSETKVLSTYPRNGVSNVDPSTSIGIRFSTAIRTIGTVTVTGYHKEVVGSTTSMVPIEHPGTLTFSSDRHSVIFTPSIPFIAGEFVVASINKPITTSGEVLDQVTLDFAVTAPNAPIAIDNSFHNDDPVLEAMLHPPAASKQNRLQSLPTIEILKNTSPAPGDLYLTNLQFTGTEKNTNYMILSNDGVVTYSRPSGKDYSLDFRPWKNGTYTYFDAYYMTQKYYVLDSTLTVIDSLKAANGYQTDGHELIYTPDGGYIMLALQNVKMDMRQFNENGNKNATVLNCIIQEFDKNKNLIFEWKALDHFKVTDAIFLDFTASMIDFCHANAIEIDADGNLLLSSRHMDEITKIDRKTGDIMWRLGGLNNQFVFTNDSIQFSHQHDIRRTAAGTYTLFDNGNLHEKGGIFSRALEYRIDELEMTATKVWEFRHDPDVFGEAMGSVKRLPNGNSLICWGACDTVSITEVTPSGNTTFEMRMEDGNYSYRAYKFTQQDLHSAVPTIAATNGLQLACYPNPITDKGEIQVSSTIQEAIRIQLYDNLGREIMGLLNGNIINTSVPIDASLLANGVYHLRVTAQSATIDREIVVAK